MATISRYTIDLNWLYKYAICWFFGRIAGPGYRELPHIPAPFRHHAQKTW